jgi:hypothetical protein
MSPGPDGDFRRVCYARPGIRITPQSFVTANAGFRRPSLPSPFMSTRFPMAQSPRNSGSLKSRGSSIPSPLSR